MRVLSFLEFKTSGRLAHVLEHGHKRTGAEMKGRTMNLRRGVCVAPVSSRGGVGIFLHEDERPFLAAEPKQLPCSLDHLQEAFFKEVI